LENQGEKSLSASEKQAVKREIPSGEKAESVKRKASQGVLGLAFRPGMGVYWRASTLCGDLPSAQSAIICEESAQQERKPTFARLASSLQVQHSCSLLSASIGYNLRGISARVFPLYNGGTLALLYDTI